jgi:hypothetical protein
MMNTTRAIGLALLLAVLPAPVAAASYDGSVPLICAATDVQECSSAGDCQRRTVEGVNLPRFIKLDFTDKTMSGTGADQRKAPITSFDRANGRIIMHGGQEGRAWSLVIDGDTGNMSAGVVDNAFAFLVFGACTPF